MENGLGIPPKHGLCHWLVRGWFKLTRRKLRLLQAGDLTGESPTIFAVSHPAGFLPALALSTATDRPVRCLLPAHLVRGPLAQFLVRQLGFILHEGDQPTSEATLRVAIDVLACGGALVVFANESLPGPGADGTVASMAAGLVWRAESQHAGRRVAVHPVHLFLPDRADQSREILIYVDSVMDRPDRPPSAVSRDAEKQAFVTTLDLRFQENAFQLRPADLEYFVGDIEQLLRTGLQEDWAARPDWKQDAEGFVLSRLVTDWMQRANYTDPVRLVALRSALDDYRRLQKQCALRELQVEGADSPLRSGWRGAVVWLEMVLGLPIALYGLLNHLVIILVLFLSGSLKRNSPRVPSTQWFIRGAVTLGLYAVQIFLVAHWRGRAAAGYYAPTLPVSGAYLWRYVELLRPQARLMFISLTIPGLTRKIKRLRQAILVELDQTLAAYEERTGVPK